MVSVNFGDLGNRLYFVPSWALPAAVDMNDIDFRINE